MPAADIKSAPPPAPYVEECDDSDDDEKPSPPPPAANTAKKVTRRDEASDSGYSSHTFATGSSSQGSKRRGSIERGVGLLKVFGMGKKSRDANKKAAAPEKTQKKVAPPQQVRRHSIARAHKTEDLRASIPEVRQDSPKKRPTVPQIETKIVRAEPPPRSPRTAAGYQPVRRPSAGGGGPMPIISVAQPLTRPRVQSMSAQQRPYSFHGGPPIMYGPSPAQYYSPAFAAPPPVVMHSAMPPYQMAGHQMAGPQLIYGSGPASPTRVINYNMNPTHPPSYFAINPGQQYWQEAPPGPLRRVSMSAAPQGHAPIVEYPRVPPGHGVDPWGRPPPPMIHSEYSTASNSPEDYDGHVFPDEDEEYYRGVKRREDKRAMPPPPLPLPQRPGLGRSATTSANVSNARRSSRASIEVPSRSSRKPSLEEGRTTPSRPNAYKRISQSSGGSGREVASNDPPSPTLRRRSRIISRPTSYQEPLESKHDPKLSAAEAYQEAQSGNAKPHAITSELVQKALRDKPEGKRSTRSHSSRTSSKSSDPRKSKHSHSERDKPREKRESEPVMLKIGRVLDPKGRQPSGRQAQGDVEVRVRHEPRGREDRAARPDRGVRYVRADKTYEYEVAHRAAPRRRSQSGRRHAHDYHPSPVLEDDFDDYREAPRRAESRTRRSSRNGHRPAVWPTDYEWVQAGIL